MAARHLKVVEKDVPASEECLRDRPMPMMKSPFLTIDLQVGGQHGEPQGWLGGVRLELGGIELEGDLVTIGNNPVFEMGRGWIRIGGKRGRTFNVRSYTYSVGNVMWDRITLWRSLGAQLVTYVRGRGFDLVAYKADPEALDLLEVAGADMDWVQKAIDNNMPNIPREMIEGGN